MTSVEKLRNRLANQFPDLEQIEESVVRFTRKAAERIFAVCYIDVSEDIPASAEALDSYQDRVLGKYYFEGPKSLQWSNYLYFVLSPEQIRNESTRSARLLVERNRKYARKFIVSLDELDKAFAPPRVKTNGKVDEGILTTWINILAESNLDSAVLNDESMPKRLDLIEAAFGASALSTPSASSVGKAEKQPFLDTLDLVDFRPHPLSRTFDFGQVNLLNGPNGAGKTSVLEAIELLYCGKSKRDPKGTEEYEIRASFSNGTSETATHSRPPATFRERDLLWYGRSEVRRNLLFESFSRFNFLNTDAAVGLAESKHDIEDDLTKLLVGPEASKAWREIERTKDGIASRIKEQSTILNEVKLQLARVEGELRIKPEEKLESEAIGLRLTEVVQRSGWNVPELGPEKLAEELVKTTAEIEPILKQAIEVSWAGSPVSEAKFRDYIQGSQAFCDSVDALSSQLKTEEKSEQVAKELLQLKTMQLEMATKATRFLESGLNDKTLKLDELKKSIAESHTVLANYEESNFEPILRTHVEITVVDFHNDTKTSIDRAAKQLADANEKFDAFSTLRDKTTRLSLELRDTAKEILEESPGSDNSCPLCHTKFSPGDLIKRIESELDIELEDKAKPLLDSVREAKETLRSENEIGEVANWAMRFCTASRLPQTTKVGILLEEITNATKRLSDNENALSQLDIEISELAKQGITIAEIDKLNSEFGSLFDGDSYTKSSSSLCQRVDLEKQDASRALKDVSSRIERVKAEISTAFQERGLSVSPNIEPIVAELKEQISTTKAIMDGLDPYRETVVWADETPLGELLVAINSIREIAADYQSTASKEKVVANQLKTASKRKEEIVEQLAFLNPRLDRLRKVQEVLQKIQSQHSLSGAVDASLKSNRCLLYTSPSPRDQRGSRMPSSA